MTKFNPKAFGLALGIFWGGDVLLMGLLALVCSWAQPFVDAVSVMYVGYNTSIIGAFIGAVWGFIDAFMCGLVFAWLYNKLQG